MGAAVMKSFRNFLTNCDGATSIEYGLIAVLVAIFLIAGATVVGQSLNTSFNSVSNGLNTTR
jgi:pilus assembly protein Flp/PilA